MKSFKRNPFSLKTFNHLNGVNENSQLLASENVVHSVLGRACSHWSVINQHFQHDVKCS